MGGRLLSWTFVAFAVALVCFASPASAKLPLIEPASYPDMTTFNCRTEAITLQPGQNLNRLGLTKACPNAERVSGPLGPEIFSAGSGAQGYMTRFQPSMVEIKPSGKLVTPAVWDLHLHHVVWLPPSGGTLAAGEEKTIATLPQGYGIKLDATAELAPRAHAPQPDRGAGPEGLPDLADRLGAGDATGADRHLADPGRVHERRQRRRLPGLRRRARVRRRRRRQVRLPRRRLLRPRRRRASRSATRSAARTPGSSPRPTRTASRCSGPAATCTRAASPSTSRWHVTGPTPATSTATTHPRCGTCSARWRSTTSRRAP